MSGGPRVSVIMGAYNDEEYVSSAVESVLAQTYEDFELIVIDDASTDGTRAVIDSFDDDRIRLLRNDANIGLTKSLNRALGEAHGEYFARQDADDYSHPHRFQRQVSYLDQHPEVALIGTGAYLVDGDHNIRGRRRVLCHPDSEDFRRKNHLVHGSVIGRADVISNLGGYDEFYRYSQDYDLWLRMVENYELRNLDEPLYYFRIHDESVYFASKEASTLYALFARATADGRVTESVRATVAEQGIEAYYEHLTDAQRAAFHRQLAEVSLRYGRLEPAREHARQAVRAENLDMTGALLYVLSRLGHRPTVLAREAMRRYLNLRISVRNGLSRALGR